MILRNCLFVICVASFYTAVVYSAAVSVTPTQFRHYNSIGKKQFSAYIQYTQCLQIIAAYSGDNFFEYYNTIRMSSTNIKDKATIAQYYAERVARKAWEKYLKDIHVLDGDRFNKQLMEEPDIIKRVELAQQIYDYLKSRVASPYFFLPQHLRENARPKELQDEKTDK